MAVGDVTYFRYVRHGGVEQKIGEGDLTLPGHHGFYSYLKEIEPPMQSTDDLLEERGKTHGDFQENAFVAQRLKEVFHSSPGWWKMTDTMREALDLMALKLSRVLTANPTYKDSWLDLSGYSMLVVKSLEGDDYGRDHSPHST